MCVVVFRYGVVCAFVSMCSVWCVVVGVDVVYGVYCVVVCYHITVVVHCCVVLHITVHGMYTNVSHRG